MSLSMMGSRRAPSARARKIVPTNIIVTLIALNKTDGKVNFIFVIASSFGGKTPGFAYLARCGLIYLEVSEKGQYQR